MELEESPGISLEDERDQIDHLDERQHMLVHDDSIDEDPPPRSAHDMDEALFQASFRTYSSIVKSCIKRAREMCASTDWEPVPSVLEDSETLDLQRCEKHDTQLNVRHHYWKVTGRLEIPADHLYKLLSDFWPKTRLSWDKDFTQHVRIVERLSDELFVAQITTKHTPKKTKQSGGQLVLIWRYYSAVNRAWTVMEHALTDHRMVDTAPVKSSVRGMSHIWTLTSVLEDLDDASSCSIQSVHYVEERPTLTTRMLNGLLHYMRSPPPPEWLRQRMHFYTTIFPHWFMHFIPGMIYEQDDTE